MDECGFKVCMLGAFSVELEDKMIDDNANRMHKIWLLLAYLLYHKNKTIPTQELIDVLWPDGEERDNPTNALRTTFYRVRSMLDKLGFSVGHNLILRKSGGYCINPDVEITLDVAKFDKFYKNAFETDDGDIKLEYFLKALKLYKGDFLTKLSSEPWVRGISVHYHEAYVALVIETAKLLEGNQRYNESVQICEEAIKIEPYSEEIYIRLMRALIELKNKEKAIKVYERMSKTFLDDFGVMPSDEIRKLYHEAIRTTNDNKFIMEDVQDELKEKDAPSGALICDYEFFKVLHYSTSRLIERSGAAVHICLLTIAPKEDKEISRRSIDLAMDNLQEQIRINLRRGDAASKCSLTQFVVMLHFAKYENSCMVCERIVKAFNRKYPHSPVKIEYSVQGVQTNL